MNIVGSCFLEACCCRCYNKGADAEEGTARSVLEAWQLNLLINCAVPPQYGGGVELSDPKAL
jgi:hypothetical protein